MADAYTATVVGAIGLAFSILALLLIVAIFVWIALFSRKRTSGDYDVQADRRNRGPVPHEGPEDPRVASINKKQLDHWKSPNKDKAVLKPNVLQKESSGNLKEITVVGGGKTNVVNGKHDPSYLHKKTSADYDVAVVSINVPASESDTDLTQHERRHQLQQHPEVYHSEVTKFVNEATTLPEAARPISYTKSHGYYGPYAQENDDDSTK